MGYFDDILNDSVSAAQIAAQTSSGAYGAAGAADSSSWQGALLGLGSSYLNGLAQIDLAKRYAQAVPQISSGQSQIYTDPDMTTRGVQAVGQTRVGDVLPLLLLGLVAWVVLES